MAPAVMVDGAFAGRADAAVADLPVSGFMPWLPPATTTTITRARRLHRLHSGSVAAGSKIGAERQMMSMPWVALFATALQRV